MRIMFCKGAGSDQIIENQSALCNRLSTELVRSPNVLIITHRRSTTERGECFQRRLFVSLLVCPQDNFRTIQRRMMKLGG